MRSAALVTLTLLALLASSAEAQPVAPCRETAEARPFASLPGTPENLHFADGALLVGTLEGTLHRLGPDGASSGILDARQPLGGLATGPDGRVYAAAMATDGAPARVVAFGSDGANLSAYAEGFERANGLAMDADGNVYLSPFEGPELVRVPRSDPASWEAWAEVEGANGLAIDADARVLYAAVSTDSASSIAAVPLDDPAEPRVVAQLSFGAATLRLSEPGGVLHEPSDPSRGPVPKGLADLDVGPDGLLYVAAAITGEILRVDPADGSACILASGLEAPVAARFASGFDGHDGRLFVIGTGGPTWTAGALPTEGWIASLAVPGLTTGAGGDGADSTAPAAERAAETPLAPTPAPLALVPFALAALLRRFRR